MSRLQQDFIFDNRYKLLKKLGEGGFSEVWLVEDTSAKITLVLKVFLPSAKLNESGIELFRNEFALVYNLNHPNLLKYTYFGVCVGYPYLVMPYYDSGAAEDLLGNCSERRVWQFLADVSSGLACMHEHQPPIIHQDIKPANILLNEQNFVITDFGISSNVKQALGLSAEGKSTIQGTRPYMPPEKFASNYKPLIASDIWALGASMYELITGKLPFGPKGGELQLQGASLPELPITISEELKSIIYQCLSPNPAERPFASDLANCAKIKLEQMPVSGTLSNSFSGTFISSIKDYKTGASSNQQTNLTSRNPNVQKKKKILFVIAAICIVGIAFSIFFLTRHKTEDKQFEQSIAYYHKGVNFYKKGMCSSQGQIGNFKNAITLFDSAQFCPEFMRSAYADSVKTIRDSIYDCCLTEGKRNFSGALYDDENRKYVLMYLEMAKSITNTSEVTQLIDSIQYIYIEQ